MTKIGPMENIYLFKLDALHIVINPIATVPKTITAFKTKTKQKRKLYYRSWQTIVPEPLLRWNVHGLSEAREARPEAGVEGSSLLRPACSAHDTEQKGSVQTLPPSGRKRSNIVVWG